MAEILISLTIIGVIAAITLPSLRANINEKTWKTQRKALYSRMSQAISMMPSLNGYGIGATDAETASKATQAFITDGLSKVLKINNICDSENFKKCGFPDEIRKFGKNSPKLNSPKDLGELNSYLITTLYSGATVIYKPINTISAVFETTSGESILTFYNPKCTYAKSPAQRAMCANFVYDLNGRKGPNQVGKDIGFMTAFYPTDSEIVMPTPFGYRMIEKSEYPVFSIAKANQKCHKVYGENTRMANIEELMSLFINNNFGYNSSSYNVFLVPDEYISSTIYDNQYYVLRANYGYISLQLTDEVNNYTSGNHAYNNIYCVKQ